MSVPMSNLYPVPDDVTDEQAAQFSVRPSSSALPFHSHYMQNLGTAILIGSLNEAVIRV
jgi:hypothetical protein